ncbi:hypothetical protein GYB62_00345 [bacterium]|nr:hypothetical protein [bacterium]
MWVRRQYGHIANHGNLLTVLLSELLRAGCADYRYGAQGFWCTGCGAQAAVTCVSAAVSLQVPVPVSANANVK